MIHLHLRTQQMKSAMLPLAMLGGVLFYKSMGYLTFLSPYLIFCMLFITYCKLNFKDLKPHKGQVLLLVTQMLLSVVVYLPLAWWNHTLAEGVFICVFIPTATAAPVITKMLGGSISFVATYSLMCNLIVAIIAPVVLAAIGDNAEIGFMESMLLIFYKVAPLLLLPLLTAIGARYAWPKLHHKIMNNQQLSFYIWAVSLFIIVGSCVSFVINTWNEKDASLLAALAAGALVVCVLQFVIGRKVGNQLEKNKLRKNEVSEDDLRVSCAQSLMQKNTVLGVWLAMTYMNPIASVAPAAYIAWHNMINSWQIMRHKDV